MEREMLRRTVPGGGGRLIKRMNRWMEFRKEGSYVCLVLDIHDIRFRNFVGANTKVGWAREGG